MNNILDVPGWLKSTDYTGAVGLTVKCYVKPDKVWEYKELIRERLQVILTKPGLLCFKLNSDYESDNILWLVEEWESPAALLTHLSTQWYQDQFLVRSEPLLQQVSQRALYKINTLQQITI